MPSGVKVLPTTHDTVQAITDDGEDAVTSEGMLFRKRNVSRAQESDVGDTLEADLAHNGKLDMTASELFKQADSDGKGTICFTEFERLHAAIGKAAMAQEKKRLMSERNRKLAKKFAAVTATLFVVMLLGNAALTTAVIFLSKDTKVVGGQLVDVAGHSLKIGSADMSFDTDGVMKLANGAQPIKTADSFMKHGLDSRLDDEVWRELKYVYLKNERGGMVNLFVQATSRVLPGSTGPGGVPLEDPLFGTYVRIQTAVGTIWLDGSIMTFHDDMYGVFTSAGFTVVDKSSPGRRLAGAFELIGLFNSLSSIDGWNSTFDSPPFIPESFTADVSVMYACNQAGADECSKRGYPTINFLGERYARSSMLLFSDATQGMVYERHSELPGLAGWTYEKLNDGSSVHQAQRWGKTGEMYACRHNSTEESAPSNAKGLAGIDPSAFLAAYAGVETVGDEEWHKIVVKSREISMMTLEYYVVILPESSVAGRTEAHPRFVQVIRGPYSSLGPDRGVSMRFAYRFDSFIPGGSAPQGLPQTPFLCSHVPFEAVSPKGGVPIANPYPFTKLGTGPQRSYLNMMLSMSPDQPLQVETFKKMNFDTGGLMLGAILWHIHSDADTTSAFEAQYDPVSRESEEFVSDAYPRLSNTPGVFANSVHVSGSWGLTNNQWAHNVQIAKGSDYLHDLITYVMVKNEIDKTLVVAFATGSLTMDASGEFTVLVPSVQPEDDNYVSRAIKGNQEAELIKAVSSIGAGGRRQLAELDLNASDPLVRSAIMQHYSRAFTAHRHRRRLFPGAGSVGCDSSKKSPATGVLAEKIIDPMKDLFGGCSMSFYGSNALIGAPCGFEIECLASFNLGIKNGEISGTLNVAWGNGMAAVEGGVHIAFGIGLKWKSFDLNIMTIKFSLLLGTDFLEFKRCKKYRHYTDAAAQQAFDANDAALQAVWDDYWYWRDFLETNFDLSPDIIDLSAALSSGLHEAIPTHTETFNNIAQCDPSVGYDTTQVLTGVASGQLAGEVGICNAACVGVSGLVKFTMAAKGEPPASDVPARPYQLASGEAYGFAWGGGSLEGCLFGFCGTIFTF